MISIFSQTKPLRPLPACAKEYLDQCCPALGFLRLQIFHLLQLFIRHFAK
jgi:hypothetical protein